MYRKGVVLTCQSGGVPRIGDRVAFRIPEANRRQGGALLFPDGAIGTTVELQNEEGLVTVKLASPIRWHQTTRGIWRNHQGERAPCDPPQSFHGEMVRHRKGGTTFTIESISILPGMLTLLR